MLMTNRFCILIFALTMLTGCSATPNGPIAAHATDEVLSRFRALDGEWMSTVDSTEMPPMAATYRTIAQGSAVVETVFADAPHEMISVFFLDGDRLRMTHYCAAQNQPHLVANEITENSVSFVVDHITNHRDPNAMYMGEATWFFMDENNIRIRWWSFENGQRGDPMTVNSTRVMD